MCGIVGYTGPGRAADILIEGLRRLEYRGYDSAGVAVIGDGRIELRRSVGKLSALVDELRRAPVEGHTGIGHTRWATHGRPSEENAHPHAEGDVAVVHNGIIENYLALKEELAAGGAVFKSETDTEVFAHLIARAVNRGKTLADAVREAAGRVRGTFAIAVISLSEPEKVVGARMECPLIAGLGDGEALISSDITAILGVTRRAVFLEDGEIAVLDRDGTVEISTFDGRPVEREAVHIDWTPVMAEKGGYRHFMLKEIFEQPRAVTDTFRGNILAEKGEVFFGDFNIDVESPGRLCIVACGTSWHAALVGKFLFEKLARRPVEVDLASEFRYRTPLVGEGDIVVAISQSGETADTLAAAREAKKAGATVLSICNVVESSLTRLSDWSFMTHAGPEIGVASTKAFTTQLAALFLLALRFGRGGGHLDAASGKALVEELVRIPRKMEEILSGESLIEELAKRYFHFRDFLYLGRGINYPIALEGALKLKEISYIHAEGYPAGEMKHGPIALIDEDMPVLCLVPGDGTRAKMLGNMEEVKARGGRIIAVTNEGDDEAARVADDVVTVPSTVEELTPLLMTLPLQLFAYHVAVLKGTDVDQPRNLAKSVTVE